MKLALSLVLGITACSAMAFDPEPKPMITEAPRTVEKSLNYSDEYRALGQPNIAFIINNSLSDGSDEWQSDERVMIQTQKLTSSTDKAGKKDTQSNAKTTIAVETRNVSLNPSEALKVKEINASFMRNLKAWGVNIYDTQTIKELDAESKKNLANILAGEVSLVAEVWLDNLHVQEPTVDYKLVDIKTGVLVANNFLHFSESVVNSHHRFEGTSSGYQKVNHQSECSDSKLQCQELDNIHQKWGAYLAEQFMSDLLAGLN